MSKPVLVDAYCGAGGATRGYQRAGFHVVGIDHKPQPHYCGDEFYQADALDVLRWLTTGRWQVYGLHEVAAIHASPPCQFFTQMSAKHRGNGGVTDTRQDLLTPTLAMLRPMSVPWVVENVPGALRAMRPTLTLHGGMFGLGVVRSRLFESNILLLAPQAPLPALRVGVYGRVPDGRRLWGNSNSGLRAAASLAQARDAMGIDWMEWDEIKEAIPPDYTHHIGAQLIAALDTEATRA